MIFKRSVFVALLLFVAGFTTQAHASPAGQDYDVVVFTSFGSQFDDVFRFGENGEFFVDGLGGGGWNEEGGREWQALAGSDGFFVYFTGVTRDPDMGTLVAVGVSSTGDTFFVVGTAGPGVPALNAGSPYAGD